MLFFFFFKEKETFWSYSLHSNTLIHPPNPDGHLLWTRPCLSSRGKETAFAPQVLPKGNKQRVSADISREAGSCASAEEELWSCPSSS